MGTDSIDGSAEPQPSSEGSNPLGAFQACQATWHLASEDRRSTAARGAEKRRRRKQQTAS